MNALQPGETSRLIERYFTDGDLDGLMSLYEEDAVFPTRHGTSTAHDAGRLNARGSHRRSRPPPILMAPGRFIIDNPDGTALFNHE